MTFDQIFAYIEKMIVCISPIICAWMAWKSTTTQKQTKEFIDLQSKYNAELEAKKAAENEAQQKLLKEMQTSIANLAKEVDTMKLSIEGLGVDALIDMSKINLEYSRSLSEVICELGTCIETSNIGDAKAVRNAITKHRNNERKIIGELAALKLVE